MKAGSSGTLSHPKGEVRTTFGGWVGFWLTLPSRAKTRRKPTLIPLTPSPLGWEKGSSGNLFLPHEPSVRLSSGLRQFKSEILPLVNRWDSFDHPLRRRGAF